VSNLISGTHPLSISRRLSTDTRKNSEKRLDLVPLVANPTWQIDTNDTWRLMGAHGEEIVRALYLDERVRTWLSPMRMDARCQTFERLRSCISQRQFLPAVKMDLYEYGTRPIASDRKRRRHSTNRLLLNQGFQNSKARRDRRMKSDSGLIEGLMTMCILTQNPIIHRHSKLRTPE
jgi:hypothetical protein